MIVKANDRHEGTLLKKRRNNRDERDGKETHDEDDSAEREP